MDGRSLELESGGLKASREAAEYGKTLQKDGQRWAFDDRVLGDSDFVLGAVADASQNLDLTTGIRAQGWNLDTLKGFVLSQLGVPLSDLQRRGRKNSRSKARAFLVALAKDCLNVKTSMLCQTLQITRAAVGQSYARALLDPEYFKIKAIFLER